MKTPKKLCKHCTYYCNGDYNMECRSPANTIEPSTEFEPITYKEYPRHLNINSDCTNWSPDIVVKVKRIFNKNCYSSSRVEDMLILIVLPTVCAMILALILS